MKVIKTPIGSKLATIIDARRFNTRMIMTMIAYQMQDLRMN